MSHTYTEPVAQLLTLGQPSFLKTKQHDYASLGITTEHIPQLIQMAQDLDELLDPDGGAESAYAPIHAWYALEQLQAHEAIKPLFALLDIEDETDWIVEEVPKVLASFGGAAIELMIKGLSDDSREWYERTPFSTGIRNIGLNHPERRDQCVHILMNQLKRYNNQEEELNGFMISDLIDLRGIEAEQLIETAFSANRVDEAIMGGWNEIKYLLQKFKNQPNDSTDDILEEYFTEQETFHTQKGVPTKQYFLAMAPLPDDIDFTLTRTVFTRTLKRDLAYCPACHTQMRNVATPFVIAHLEDEQEEETYFTAIISSAGYFCPACPAVTVDLDQYWEDLEDEGHSEDDLHAIIGIILAASIPAESAHLGIYEIEPPPIVPYLLEGFEGALEEKKRSYVRSKKKKKRRR